MSTAEELERLVALRDRGVLSEEEFQAEKARVLGPSSAAAGPSASPPPTEPLSPRPSASSGEPTAPGFVASPLGPTAPPTPSPAPTGGEGGQTQGGVLTGKRVLIGLVILAVLGAGAGLGIALTGKSTPAGASEVFLQPKNAQGQHPFTPNVGTDASVPSTASGALTPTSGTSLASYSGNSVGLYGGTLDQSSCNPQQMITYLEANPSKASAWAAAEGISVSQVSTYIGGLTPMTLRYDTRVTNHGYVNGQANAIPEILQAGQAVLVDSHGVPRARCYCGNPLTPPEAVAGTPRYVGAQWSEFSPNTVIVVQQSTTVINNFTLINNSTGQAFSRPAGTTGTSDTPAPTCTGGPSMPGVTVCTNPTTTTLPPTTTTTVPPTTTTTGVAPLLGSAAWGQALGSFGGISGFGEVAPTSINAAGGNAPGSYVNSISWSNWGAPQAMGQGQTSYVSDPNAPLSDATAVTATVVAFDLGSCDGGPPAYQEVTWYVPQLGQTFDPTMATNACTGPS
jgi:hypothetical protein